MTDKYTRSNPVPRHTSYAQSTPQAFPSSQSKRVGMQCLTTSLKMKIKTLSLFLQRIIFLPNTEREREINLLKDRNICWRRNLRGCWKLALWKRRCWGEPPFWQQESWKGGGRKAGTTAFIRCLALTFFTKAIVSSALLGSLEQQFVEPAAFLHLALKSSILCCTQVRLKPTCLRVRAY